MLQPPFAGGTPEQFSSIVPSFSQSVQRLGGSSRAAFIPTRALILDRGQWWVLVRRGGQDVRQQVVPGAADGSDTAILRGLSAGEQVVVTNAYLRFHRDVAARFQPPD